MLSEVLGNRVSSFGLKLVQNTARGKKHFPLRSKKIFKIKSQCLKQALYLLKYSLFFKSVDVFSVSNLCFFKLISSGQFE